MMECADCNQSFSRFDNLKRHRKYIHEIPNKKIKNNYPSVENDQDVTNDVDSDSNISESSESGFEEEELDYYSKYLKRALYYKYIIKKEGFLKMVNNYSDDTTDVEESENDSITDDLESNRECAESIEEDSKLSNSSSVEEGYNEISGEMNFKLTIDQIKLLYNIVNVIKLNQIDLDKKQFITMIEYLESDTSLKKH